MCMCKKKRNFLFYEDEDKIFNPLGSYAWLVRVLNWDYRNDFKNSSPSKFMLFFRSMRSAFNTYNLMLPLKSIAFP